MPDEPIWKRLKRTIRGQFSNEAGLRRQWQHALQERDPQLRLDGLRQVQLILYNNPSAFSHLYLEFLNNFFDERWVGRLTTQDLRLAEAMGDALVGNNDAACSPVDVWRSVARAYGTRVELVECYNLLGRVYHFPEGDRDVRRLVVLDLMDRGSIRYEQLVIYQDFFTSTLDNEFRKRMLAFLTELCTLDLQALQIDKLKDDYKILTFFLSKGIDAPGRYAVLGFYSLLIEDMLPRAISCFEIAISEKQNSSLARIGLLIALLRQKNYQEAMQVLLVINQQTEFIAPDLNHLRQALYWLHMPDLGIHPLSVQSHNLTGNAIRNYVGEIADIALAKVLLLEGEAQQATHILRSLTRSSSAEVSLFYYRAWASLLCSDHQDVIACFKSVNGRQDDWTVACLLLESNPTALPDSEIEALLLRVPPVYREAFNARVALARSSPPPAVELAMGKGSLEGDMELLRTVLGVAFYRRDEKRMQQALASPLFLRLPLADQFTWRGLLALQTEDGAKASEPLFRAALHYKYQRAALILALHLLEQEQLNKVQQVLDIAAQGRSDARVAKLQNYLDLLKQGEAPDTLHDTAIDDPKHMTILGKSFIYQAQQAYKKGERLQEQYYMQEAKRYLALATQKGSGSLSLEDHVFARSVVFLNDPEREATSCEDLWDEVLELDPSSQQPWLTWIALLALLWNGKPAGIAVACEELVVLLKQAQSVEDSTLIALAVVIAHASPRIEKISQGARMLELLEYLSTRSQSPVVKQTCRRCIALVAQQLYSWTTTPGRVHQHIEQLIHRDPNNVSLLLLLTSPELAYDQQALIKHLRLAQPEDEFERQLCICLVMLLSKDVDLQNQLSPIDEGNVSRAAKATNLLLFLAASAVNKTDIAFESLRVALRQPFDEVITFIDMRQCFFSACATLLKGRYKPAVVEVATTIVDFLKEDDALSLTLTRCLAAVGEKEIACRNWESLLDRQSDPGGELYLQYAQYLFYLAVQEYNERDHNKSSINRIHRVAQLAERGGMKIAGMSSQKLKQLADQLGQQRDVYILLTGIGMSKPDGLYAPGRYRFLEEMLEHGRVLPDGFASISEFLSFCVYSQKNIGLLHSLAVLLHEFTLIEQEAESPLWYPAMAFWIFLLSTKEFWEYFARERVVPSTGERSTLSTEKQDALLAAALQHFLSLHSTLAGKALATRQYEKAKKHFRCLELCALEEKGLLKILREYFKSAFSRLNVDRTRFRLVKEYADKIFAEWNDKLLVEADRLLNDPSAIGKLPQDITRNYEGAIRSLQVVLDCNFVDVRLLRTCLEWYNDWSDDLRKMATTDDRQLVALTWEAKIVAERLIPLCQKGQKFEYRPENQALAIHFNYQGMFSPMLTETISMCREAIEWNAYRTNADVWIKFATDVRKDIQTVKDFKTNMALSLLRLTDADLLKHITSVWRGVNPQYVEILLKSQAGYTGISIFLLNYLVGHPNERVDLSLVWQQRR